MAVARASDSKLEWHVAYQHFQQGRKGYLDPAKHFNAIPAFEGYLASHGLQGNGASWLSKGVVPKVGFDRAFVVRFLIRKIWFYRWKMIK